MEISVVGCGYLGAIHAVAMASLGHSVVGIDNDEHKIALLNQGRVPFHEARFEELLVKGLAAGKLRFSTDITQVADADAHFVCVGTPQSADSGAADLSYLDAAVTGLVGVMKPGSVLVGKSTVPVGTAAALAERLAQQTDGVTLVWNPEFLREGFAVKDTLSPDRIVYGLPQGSEREKAAAVLDEVYHDQLVGQGIPKLTFDYATAELIKVAANSFLALKISFINAVAEVCDVAGADVTGVAKAIGLDERIGPKFLRAGVGYGGGCLPKDTRAFAHRASELGSTGIGAMLEAANAVNAQARQRAVNLVLDAVGGTAGGRVAVLGAAFKPDSDDLRDSPAVAVALELQRRGATVRVYDPAAGPKLAQQHPELTVASSVQEAAKGADAVAVLTEWSEFRDLDPRTLDDIVAHRTIIDGRNALDPQVWRAAGWTYRGMGRP